MFQDEAGFGRINKPKYCWCFPGHRPEVPCQHIREYRYTYGAVEPLTGESFFLVMPYCNTTCMNIFLQELAKQYPEDRIILVCDGASWHRAKALKIPSNVRLLFLPPATPEMRNRISWHSHLRPRCCLQLIWQKVLVNRLAIDMKS